MNWLATCWLLVVCFAGPLAIMLEAQWIALTKPNAKFLVFFQTSFCSRVSASVCSQMWRPPTMLWLAYHSCLSEHARTQCAIWGESATRNNNLCMRINHVMFIHEVPVRHRPQWANISTNRCCQSCESRVVRAPIFLVHHYSPDNLFPSSSAKLKKVSNDVIAYASLACYPSRFQPVEGARQKEWIPLRRAWRAVVNLCPLDVHRKSTKRDCSSRKQLAYAGRSTVVTHQYPQYQVRADGTALQVRLHGRACMPDAPA